MIEEILVLLIEPVELEVHHADSLPVVGNLSAGAIDHMADLVGHDELEVLHAV